MYIYIYIYIYIYLYTYVFVYIHIYIHTPQETMHIHTVSNTYFPSKFWRVDCNVAGNITRHAYKYKYKCIYIQTDTRT